jgi:predicted metal-binding membrane protein
MRVFLALAGLSLAAWTVQFAGIGTTAIGAFFCGPADRRALASPFLLLAFATPGSLLASWAPMMLAMMPPLLVQPLLHIRRQSFARRRWRGMLLFAAGYGTVWLAAGLPLLLLAWWLIALSPGAPYPGAAFAFLAACAWQLSPAKQACLNGCHRQPALAAFGIDADLHALAYGAKHALWCVGACAPLMLAAECVEADTGFAAAMPLAALFALAERFERPGPFVWRLRLPCRLTLIAVNLCRLKIGSRLKSTS